MATEQRYLGEVLARRGAVPAERLEGLYAVQREKGVDLVRLLIESNVTDGATVARALAEESQLPLVTKIDPATITTELATKLPIGFAKNHSVIAVGEDELRVHVIIADPFDTGALDDVRVLFGKPVDASVATAEHIDEAINRVYER